MRRSPLIVLKFGSSVLRTEGDVPSAVHEIYRWRRQGYLVLAVVSAFESKTNELLAHARRYSDRPDDASVAALVATGEATSAALLSLALDRAGVPSVLLDADRIGLCTRGPLLDADPFAVNCDEVDRCFERCSVAVVPGFVGRADCGSLSLLGRGGSDLTALFLASRLHAERCRLIKDVDGLFDCDPAQAVGTASRYETLTWQDAINLNADVVQCKSLIFSEENELSFEVAALGSDEGTLIGCEPTQFYSDAAAPQAPLRVGLLGLGTVGFGVYQALVSQPQFTVTKVAARKLDVHAAKGVPSSLLTHNAWDVVESDCDVVVELIGGNTLPAALITAALTRRKHVVTANKLVIAERGPALSQLAAVSGARLCYSAAVGGAVPMLETVQQLAETSGITSIRGALNGTTTFVLDELAKGATFQEALQTAQACGFAEADATFDLDGTDAANKLVLLARAAFGADLELGAIERSGIEHLAPDYVRKEAERGNVVRLVASLQWRDDGDGLCATVQPLSLAADDPLAQTWGERCSLEITCADGTRSVLHGKGAGRWPTTESVIADLLSLLHEPDFDPSQQPTEELTLAGGAQ